MLLKEAILTAVDNSGAKFAMAIQLYTIYGCHAKFLQLAILKRFDIRRKLTAKRKYKVVPLVSSPRLGRWRGQWVMAKNNTFMVMHDNRRRMLGSRCYSVKFREVASIAIERIMHQKMTS